MTGANGGWQRQWPAGRRAAACGFAALISAACLSPTVAAAERIEIAQAAPAAPAVKNKSKAAASTPSGASDAGLSRRVEQLEEQLVDMQVTIGTLESLARSGGGARAAGGSGGGGSAGDAVRMEGMETQIRALSAEVQRLSTQLRQMGGSDRGDIGGGPRYAEAPRAQPAPRVIDTTPVPGFGSTTVQPAQGDPIGTLIEGAPSGGAPYSGRETEVAALPPVDSGNPKQDYETAYGHLLRQDYGAAEAAFEDFLQRYPNDPLAGNAQYWLGETHFVRGSYKPAAAAFLKGYQTYGKGNKAPDSLLKLAMSLDKLGQKDAACSSFRELTGKFPQAPLHVKGRADSEMKRLGCN